MANQRSSRRCLLPTPAALAGILAATLLPHMARKPGQKGHGQSMRHPIGVELARE
jgi:hypothetical protein